MFHQFMTDLIDQRAFKKILSEQAMVEFSKQPGVYLVQSPVLYRLYTLYTEDKSPLEERPAFYRKAGVYLYYERFTCAHGDEFYYYVKFNTYSPFYQEHQDFIKMLILASDPSTLTDYVGTKDLTIYNRVLKEQA